MKRAWLRLAALVLAAVLLCGCAAGNAVPYRKMEYQRPDVAAVQQALDTACQAAAGQDTGEILEAVYSFYDAYDWFYTCYALAQIRYSGDLTDIYWEQEADYCGQSSALVDQALETLNDTLARSPCRQSLEAEFFGEGFFDSYDGENLWDEEFSDMLTREAQLESRYYALSEQSLEYEYGSEAYYDACAGDMAQLLVELIALRQEMAAYWGYNSYPQFASDFSYYRDYTAAQSESLLEDIRRELVPLYRHCNTSQAWEASWVPSSEQQTLRYVGKAAKNMGGIPAESFSLMESAGLYDIAYGENKYNSSFEIYLTSYLEPFVFMNPTLTVYDRLTLAHEFGHFCNDYASFGSYAGIDVMEVFSQGMEYLSLCYGENTQALTQIKLLDSLCIYVEQAAYASFEQRMYDLEGEALTEENLYALYDQVARSYGLDGEGYDSREFVTVTHYYTDPMYIISYVVSNDAAMQLYRMEQEQPGSGLKLYEENLATEEAYFLAFLDSAGLESPFASGRMAQVRELFEKELG